MTKNELYQKFTHYEALSKAHTTFEQRVEIYRLMEQLGIHVPEETESRLRKGRFPMNCDFFISKHPTATIIKWIPTRSPEKQAKFIYKDYEYFHSILSGAKSHGVVIDPSAGIMLDEQLKHVGAVMLKSQQTRNGELAPDDVKALINEVETIVEDSVLLGESHPHGGTIHEINPHISISIVSRSSDEKEEDTSVDLPF